MERIAGFDIDQSSTGQRVQINFNPAPPPKNPRSFRLESPPIHTGLRLTVDFATDEGDNRIIGAALHAPEGLSASELSRFPWSRWLGVADANARLRNQFTIAGRDAAAAIGGEAVLATRPGRRGHPVSHYRDIARRYLDLTSAGHSNPTQQIAEERDYSRNTVAGWVRHARTLGFLPPARKGRAG